MFRGVSGGLERFKVGRGVKRGLERFGGVQSSLHGIRGV